MQLPNGSLSLLFPGQGVDPAAQRDEVRELRPDLFALAVKLCSVDPFSRAKEGTQYAQPAVYSASLAGFERLGRPAAEFHAGHSLGEISALAAAGAIDSLDGLRIVAARGQLMSEAAAAAGEGGMLAVDGDHAGAEELAAATGLVVANQNSPRQFVLSGPQAGIDRAREEARGRGLRAKQLAVAGAFHTNALDVAAAPFRELLDSIEFRRPRVPVYSCVTARPFEGDIAALLTASLTHPVRWLEVMQSLHAAGVRRFVDVGPGRVLSRLVSRTLDDAVVDPDEILELQHA